MPGRSHPVLSLRFVKNNVETCKNNPKPLIGKKIRPRSNKVHLTKSPIPVNPNPHSRNHQNPKPPPLPP